MITIIDYGIGNLGSVQNMLKKVGAECEIASGVNDIAQATKLIFPGVGAFKPAMERLRAVGLIDVLTRKAMNEKVPILGICLGMQLMTRGSEEGGPVDGLGWIDAKTVRFSVPEPLKVPHKGWNFVKVARGNPFFSETEELKFYFDHSYHVKLLHPEEELFSTRYGSDFTSGFRSGNLMGVQFHPEKSHRYGMALLGSFANL